MAEKVKCPVCRYEYTTPPDLCPKCRTPASKSKEVVRHEQEELEVLAEWVRIPELQKAENARWLALLTDTEGALGWTRHIWRGNRIDERYRYEYITRTPYIGADMDELESKETVDKGAEMIGTRPYSTTDPRTGKPLRRFDVKHGRARSAMHHMKPHLVKFRRLANLCLTLFRYHTYIPIERFDKVIEMLFGRYMTPTEANHILLRMTETEFREFMKRAEELTNLYLK